MDTTLFGTQIDARVAAFLIVIKNVHSSQLSDDRLSKLLVLWLYSFELDKCLDSLSKQASNVSINTTLLCSFTDNSVMHSY
jgi:hypothetical protein